MISVRYLVHDVGQAITFYTQLGFALRQQFGPAMAIMGRDDLTLWLAGPRASAARPMPDGRKPEPGGWNRFVLQVTDLAGTGGNTAGTGRDIPQRYRRRTRRAADPLRGSVGQRGGTVRAGSVAVARQCTATKTMLLSDATSRATSRSSTTAIAVPSAA